ncbi:MAG: response regulator [Sphingobacteriia bacterium]|nr:response regulator [Sphingobacteriia bacterium]NCC39383.1 response regulator [Gammaproteobacteria bacterium]
MNDLPVSEMAHILVVDDQLENLQLLIALLSPDYQVHPFAEGMACLRYLEADRPADLLLLDVVMPAPDGYAVCQGVRALPDRAELPIIFLTALDSLEDEARGLAVGAVDYIAKPFSPAIVLARVRNQVRLSQAMRLIQRQNDILEQRVAERTQELTVQRLRLRELNRRNELAVKAGNIGVWDWDVLENRLVWDERMFRLHGVRPESYRGTYEDWRDCLHPDDLDLCEQELRLALAGEKDLQIEYRVIWPDGSLHYLVGTARVERDEQGAPVRATGVNYDVTARKLAEIELTQGREMLRLILDSTAEAIYGIDPQGRCTFCNRSCLTLLGRNMHDLIHHSYAGGEPYPEPDCKLAKAYLHGEGTHVLDEVLWRKDGTDFPAEIWSYPQWQDGHLVGAVVTFIDITQRKEGERALLQAKTAAEAANRAKSEFLANMSHEIRTPMTGVIGMAQLVLRTQLDDRQLDYVHKIETSAQSLLQILNDILDLSKIEAGVMRLESRPFDLWHLTTHALHLLDVQAEHKGLQLVIDYDPQLGHDYRGDPLRLTQILSNLLANAVKFTDAGEVRLVIRPGQPNGIHFAVQDTGIGMTAAEIARLFHPFAQADGSISRRYGGTGLGLAISQNLVSLMDGDHIEVKSTPGQGSCFSFRIPVAPCPAPANLDRRAADVAAPCGLNPVGTKAPSPLARPDVQSTGLIQAEGDVQDWNLELSGRRLLLVEDNPINQAVVLGLLEGSGLCVEVAANGLEGVRRCQEAVFDLILMDMQMPVMDGLEATRRIRVLDPRVPIVALTANAFADDIARTRAAGMNTHLSKPIDMVRLQSTLNHFLSRRLEPDPG